jgi:hypothetical protein
MLCLQRRIGFSVIAVILKMCFENPTKKKTEKASFLSVSLLMCIVHDAFKYFGELAKTPQWCILCANVILGHIHGE